MPLTTCPCGCEWKLHPRTRGVFGADLRVGDVVAHQGRRFRVDELLPYVGKLVDNGVLPQATRFMRSEGGRFEMTITPNGTYRVIA